MNAGVKKNIPSGLYRYEKQNLFKKIKVDQHQDDQEAQEHPPSTRMFLMAFQHYRPYVSYIFGNLG